MRHRAIAYSASLRVEFALQTSSSPLQTNKICLFKIISKSVGATCGRPRKTMKFYVIHGIYLINQHTQTCRDRCVHATSCRLSEPYNKFYVIYGGYLNIKSHCARRLLPPQAVPLPLGGRLNVAALCGGYGVATSDRRGRRSLQFKR